MRRSFLLGSLSALALPLLPGEGGAQQEQTLLNVSYDPTRELYRDINTAFAAAWRTTARGEVRIRMSHGGSGRQARSVIDGLEADVVTLALGQDIDVLAGARLVARDWREALPARAAPYRSTIVFLVRRGNPKGIKDWGDIVRPGIQVVTPNPKTSGGARWNYLAAWGWALAQPGGSDAAAREMLTTVFRNAPVLDTGARGSLTTFVRRSIGDVMLAWENEAFLARQEFGADAFQVVVPGRSILAEPPVAVVEAVARRRGTLELARAYLEFLYTPQAQALIARHGYRPVAPQHAAAEDRAKFPNLELFTIDDVFGGWAKATEVHFADGAMFDRIMAAR